MDVGGVLAGHCKGLHQCSGSSGLTKNASHQGGKMPLFKCEAIFYLQFEGMARREVTVAIPAT